MRVVADTNTVISGLLWRDAPREVLDAAAAGRIQFFTSVALLAELDEVLRRPKFSQRLELANVSLQSLIADYAALCTFVKPTAIAPTILADPDDDDVLACAIAANAEVIVSGDSHLLTLQQYNQTRILTASALLSQLNRHP